MFALFGIMLIGATLGIIAAELVAAQDAAMEQAKRMEQSLAEDEEAGGDGSAIRAANKPSVYRQSKNIASVMCDKCMLPFPPILRSLVPSICKVRRKRSSNGMVWFWGRH